MKRLFRFDAGVAAILVTLIVGAALYLADPAPIRALRNAVFDQYQRWYPRTYEVQPVRIVDVDDESLRLLGQWPWPRTRIAELIRRLQDAGAAAISFDVIFAEEDRTSPKSVAAIWNLQGDLRERLLAYPDHDQVMAQAIERGNVVLAFAGKVDGASTRLPLRPFRVINKGETVSPYLYGFKGAETSLELLERAAAGVGTISFIPDKDGVVRRVPLLVRVGEQVMPSLMAESLRVGVKQRNYVVTTAPQKGAGMQEIRIGDMAVPTTANGEMWVHYTRPAVPGSAESARYIPAWRVLEGEVTQGSLVGHVVLIGVSAQGLFDLRTNALGDIMPGVEAHAQALEQILSSKHLHRPSWARGGELVLLVVGGLLIGVVALFSSALVSASVTAVVLLLMGVGGWFAFTRYGLLLDPLTPGLPLLLTFTAGSVMHHLASERKQRWVRDAFSRYVSPNRVDFLVENPGQLELGGRRQECSFVFTDLQGFTTLMEKMDPGNAVALLNAYLDKMIAIAFQQGGTLDRIVGDAVAIMFSAPVEQADHRQRALNCALEMYAFATAYSAELAAQGTHFGKTRIGVHSGEVIVGNFGGSNMFDYRALGDPVNTAARLESVNKHLGTTICVSEVTLSGCPGVAVRPIGKLVLKGKSEALMVYEPLASSGGESLTQDPAYEAAFALLRDRDARALEVFERLVRERPQDPLAKLHLERLQAGEQGDLIVMDEK